MQSTVYQAAEFATECELGRVKMTEEIWKQYRTAIRLIDASNKAEAESLRYKEAAGLPR